MLNKKKVIILSWVVVLLWMLLIFKFSSQVGYETNKLSKSVTEVVVDTAEKVAPKYDFNINRFNYIIRKNAHFILYLILGVLVLNAMKRSRQILGFKVIIITILFCVLYAVSDEIHQSYVPGRQPRAFDVLIDSLGAILGIFIYSIISCIRNKLIKNIK